MKTKSKFVFSMLVTLMLLTMLIGAGPVEQVKAEAAESPLAVGGDFVWAKGVGSGETGVINSSTVKLDSTGNIYILGNFLGSIDFDPGTGKSYLVSPEFNYQIYILRLDHNGNFVWVKTMVGVWKADFFIDKNDNLYITGDFEGTVDFDPGAGVFNLTSVGGRNIFISKLDKNGNFLWAKSMGAPGNTYGWSSGSGVTVDLAGNIYLTGDFSGVIDFDPGLGVFNLLSVDFFGDVFVTKLDKNGNFVWAGSWGGITGMYVSDSMYGGAVLDSNGNVYTTGSFGGTVDFDPGPGVYTVTAESGNFLSKLTSDGDFVWVKTDIGIGRIFGVDTANNLYFNDELAITKFDDGSNLIWKKSFVAEDRWVAMNGMEVALNGDIYTTGYFSGTVDFDPGEGEFKLTSNGIFDDIFISKLDANGNFIWVMQMGGEDSDYGNAIALDRDGSIVTTGIFLNTADFDPGDGVFNLTPEGRYGMFISKLEGYVPPTFGDVPFDHPLHDYIEALYDAGYTAGCSTSPLMFCPDTILDRAQSAVFMLRGQMGSGYTPPPAPWNTFGDDWTGFEWAEPWAEGMYQEGLTQGCQTNPLMYCPSTQLPRVEASVFGLRMKYGVNYTPPTASGTLFADFPSTDPSYWAIDWAEQAYLDGLLPACGTDSATGKPMFCPSQLVDRGWGAYLIVKAKNLPLP